MLVDEIISFLEEQGIKLDDKEDVKTSIQSAITDDRIRILYNDFDLPIGFYTWEEHHKDNKLEIFINNMFIKKEYRREYNLLKLREWFREMYPRANIFSWKNRKTKRLFICN